MRKFIPLSLLTLSALLANDITLEKIDVSATTLSDVAQNAKTSADVAKALSDNIPSVDMNRRSGIANDIYIRGQKRDNISIEVDGTKVYGACPNRMDPPTSHIVAHQIDKITVIEGPYDVESFGVLSGGLKIDTKKPTKNLQGSINLSFGAWNYQKFGATISGGNDFIRVIATVSDESSDQYEDGDGNTMAQQIDNYAALYPTNIKLQAQKFKPEYKDMPAYKKKSAMLKAFINTAKNQELRLSVTANRSDNVLYGNTPMDAIYDDSNIYNVTYNINSIDENFKNLNVQYYHSDVKHPMSNVYRLASNNPAKYWTHSLTTSMDGFKLKNTFEIQGHTLILGLDTSKRNWDGHYEKNRVETTKSIDDTDTKDTALFLQLEKSLGNLDVTLAARVDDVIIQNKSFDSRHFSYGSANLMTTYHFNKDTKLFFGIAQASRVPDARELYFVDKNSSLIISTQNLKKVTNQEIDLGYETDNNIFQLKAKLFYSMLDNYIYYRKTTASNRFENIDATLYGAEVSGSIYATDDLTIDMSASYKVGKKEKALQGQTDTDLADIAPLRANIAANYEYTNNSLATIELQASDRWDNFDADNGEQEIAGWAIVNAKIKHAVNKKFDLTIGINNIFNITYALSNTYADLTLLSGTTDVMLLNETGRYFYTNIDFKF
ncbi:MAG: TonB-dependent receptor [Epsilonproteobacteria bacterium]|nr:TonB-dependent receptor [Campylobacterota bacterium]